MERVVAILHETQMIAGFPTDVHEVSRSLRDNNPPLAVASPAVSSAAGSKNDPVTYIAAAR